MSRSGSVDQKFLMTVRVSVVRFLRWMEFARRGREKLSSADRVLCSAKEMQIHYLETFPDGAAWLDKTESLKDKSAAAHTDGRSSIYL